MSTPASTTPKGADLRPTAAPYAFPQPGGESVDRGSIVGWANVGPYVPEPWRGKPAVDGPRAVTPRAVTPRAVTPRAVTPIFGAPIAVTELLAAAMPPSYPTPAYFTPLGSQAQEDFVTAAFEMPAIIDAVVGPTTVSFVDPSASEKPTAPALPWIDAFLSSTPAMPMRAVDTPVASFTPVASYTPAESDAIVEEALAAEWPMTAAAPEAPTPSDAWALDEAAEQMRALADELRDHEGIASDSGEAAGLFETSPVPEPLPVWSDDDMIDIMPAQKGRSATSVNSAIEPWADRARRSGDESAEAAARVLELLARRVRDGEISLAGYEPRLGDAAALAAALAALLGVRR